MTNEEERGAPQISRNYELNKHENGQKCIKKRILDELEKYKAQPSKLLVKKSESEVQTVDHGSQQYSLNNIHQKKQLACDAVINADTKSLSQGKVL